MAVWSKILLFVLLCAVVTGSRAATRAEEREFRAAAGAFQIEQWARAETELARFVEQHPESTLVAEAVLLQAQAQFKQGKLKEAIELLQTHQERAGETADRYLYWIGEVSFQLGDFARAADCFGQLSRNWTNSPRRLEATVGEAAARARLGQWLRVGEVLGDTNGAFQVAARTNPDSTWVTRGLLLLTEAGLARNEPAAAQITLASLEKRWLEPEQAWQRQQLRVRIALAAGQTNDALNATAELDALAKATGRNDFIAESAALEATVLERLGRRADAQAAYRRNLTAETPPDRQREALAKIVDLALAQNQTEVAEQTLERFLARFPASPAADVALLTIGELHLKRFVEMVATNGSAARMGATNLLEKAQSAFDQMIAAATNSSYLGKAHLNRGWCFWLTVRIPESLAAFDTAAKKLPESVDLAVAQLKAGDAAYLERKFIEAREWYRRAMATTARVPAAQAVVADFALYQLVRACLESGDLTGAEAAMRSLLALSPQRELAERTLLQVAQGYADVFEPDQALELYEQFLEAAPTNRLRPQVELAAARAEEQKGDWRAALARYDRWVTLFPTNELRPDAEFHRAMAGVRSGELTNGVALFTNFVVAFSSNALVAPALWWLGQHSFEQGDFPAAETHFKLLFQNWPRSDLAHEARLMAGRAAILRLDPVAAINHFTNLTSDLKNCPPGIRRQALFAYGDTLMSLTPAGTNRLANLTQAIEVFGTIQRENADSEAGARALGQAANCYRQMASVDAAYLAAATNAYQQVIVSPAARVSTRSQAQVGLGNALEKYANAAPAEARRAFFASALDHYLDVVLEKNLRPGELPDLYWTKVAGLEAGRLMESLGDWRQAEQLYARLKELLPALSASLDRKIAAVRERNEKPAQANGVR